MTEKVKTPLDELKLYLGIEYNLMKIKPRMKLERILEKTIIAINAGATLEQIKEVFSKYTPDRDCHDPTYG